MQVAASHLSQISYLEINVISRVPLTLLALPNVDKDGQESSEEGQRGEVASHGEGNNKKDMDFPIQQLPLGSGLSGETTIYLVFFFAIISKVHNFLIV